MMLLKKRKTTNHTNHTNKKRRKIEKLESMSKKPMPFGSSFSSLFV